MKTYNQFLNESQAYSDKTNPLLPKNFEFVIDISNSTKQEISDAFKEFEKYAEVSDYTKKYLTTKDSQAKPWAWIIDIHQGIGLYITLNIITTYGWGIGDEDKVDDRITIKEFLEVGLKGAKDLVDAKTEMRILKNTADKYNI